MESTDADAITPAPAAKPKPAILCLHGYGTNGEILRHQLRALLPLLSPLHLLTPTAPFPVSALGPGASPAVFSAPQYRPYCRWHSESTVAAAFGVSSATLLAEKHAVRTLLRETIAAAERDGYEVVGVLGFSQGAMLAAAVCQLLGKDGGIGGRIGFAVLVCSYYTPLTLGEEEGVRRAAMPSVHVVRRGDPWRVRGERVREEYFEAGRAVVVELDGGHEVPVRRDEVGKVVRAVKMAWREARRERGM